MSIEAGFDYSGADLDKTDVVLETESLRKEFGGLIAVEDVSIAVEDASITGLIGPNGAGKSTLFNVISGYHPPDGGRVRFGGSDITGYRPDDIAQFGLVRTFQTPRKLEGMTVRENMLVGAPGQRGESLLSLFTARDGVYEDEISNLERAAEMLELFELDHLADEPSTELSGGQFKLLELARALMVEPDMLLLDEPMAGVNPVLSEKLAGHIRMLNDELGITLVIIEHDIDFIMEIADPIIVLDQGKVLMEGSPEEVRNDDRVMEAYLGGT